MNNLRSVWRKHLKRRMRKKEKRREGKRTTKLSRRMSRNTATLQLSNRGDEAEGRNQKSLRFPQMRSFRFQNRWSRREGAKSEREDQDVEVAVVEDAANRRYRALERKLKVSKKTDHSFLLAHVLCVLTSM